MVFQHSGFLNTGAAVVWQPGSHNLAFSSVTSSDGNRVSTLEIWDGTTGKLVAQHAGGNSNALAWSPDGKEIAYAVFDDKNVRSDVIIIDATTGKQVYVYKEHHLSVSVIVWSPDGKYIASAEGNSGSNTVAKVWTA